MPSGSARAALDGSIPFRTAYAQHGVQTHGVLLPCTTMCWSWCGGEGGLGALVLRLPDYEMSSMFHLCRYDGWFQRSPDADCPFTMTVVFKQ